MSVPVIRRLGGILTGVALALPAIATSTADPAVVAAANQKWREAHCTIRISVELKKGKNSEGWSRSPMYSVGMMHTSTPTGILVEPATAQGEKAFYFTMEVSDRDAVAPLLSGSSIPAGTEFIAEGWFLQRPEKQEGPYLQLRFARMPQVKARFWFLLRGSFRGAAGFPIKHFEPVERYLRIEAFKLEAADERLTPVASTAPGAGGNQVIESPSPTSRPAALPVASSAAPFKPSVRVLAIACQPARLGPGDEVDLVMTYVIDGIPPGNSFEVVERREILRDGTVVGSFETPLGRLAGTFASTQRVKIPESAAAGLYTARGSATMAGVTSSAEALLEVRDH